MHPKLLQQYAEFCDIRERVVKSDSRMKFGDATDFSPVKFLPLCDLLDITDMSLSFFHFRPSYTLVVIPWEKQSAGHAFQRLSVLHKGDPNACGGEQTFKYVISELIDNIYEHSGFTRALATFNKNPAEGFVDLCIFDNGVTIPRNISKYGLVFEKDFEFIIEAINGLSTKPEAGRGMGLGSSIRILLAGLESEVLLVSGQGGLYLSRKQKIKYNLTQKMKLNGTLIDARIPYPSPSIDFYKYIQ